MSSQPPSQPSQTERKASIVKPSSAGMFNNFSSNPSSYNETRDELKKEVTGKVVYNVNSIIEHFMRINANTKSEQGGDLPDSRIAQCIAQIGTGDLITLHQIVDDSKQNERAMYGPLENIMNAIGDFFAPQGRAPKRFVQQSGFTHVDEVVQQMAFPPRFPDFLMLPEKLSWLSQKPDKAHLKVSWSTTEALVEVKHSATKGSPFYARQSQQETGVKGIIAQTADYVRLRLSARPFQLYTLAFLIYGAECCIAIYDRYGVLLSPGYKVYERVVGPDGNFDYELSYDFVRILARLTCGLSAEDFGSDPTVELRSGNPQKPPSYSVGYKPSASIIPATPLTGPNARYNTVGSPIWSSLSLLGRGTSVWYVKDPTGVRKKVVMKSAWRAGSRTPESSIYEYLKQTLKNLDGIAAFVEGLDVYLDQQTPMRVQNLRIARFNYPVAGTVAETIPFDEDPVLHRLILASVGKPLWEYETPLDFVQGCIAVVSALERLAAHDILHRDVSPGNVLLAADESPRKNNEGFLSDLEFLYIPGMGDTVDPQPTGKLPEHVARPDGTLHRVDEIRNDDIPQLGRHYIYPQDAKPEPKPQGPPITGTAQFMAVEVLDHIVQSDTSFNRTPLHDLESFIYVLVYALHRRAYDRAQNSDTRKAIGRVFTNYFAQTSHTAIRDVRRSMSSRALTSKSALKIFSEEVANGSHLVLCALLTQLLALVRRRLMRADGDTTIERMAEMTEGLPPKEQSMMNWIEEAEQLEEGPTRALSHDAVLKVLRGLERRMRVV